MSLASQVSSVDNPISNERISISHELREVFKSTQYEIEHGCRKGEAVEFGNKVVDSKSPLFPQRAFVKVSHDVPLSRGYRSQ
ncbi:MAG: hypothetical protein AB7G93_01960 [Bdellovibrionales bacterium]